MIKKRMLIIFIILILVSIMAIIGIVIYGKNNSGSDDDNSGTNKKILGDWHCSRSEIYENGELKLSIIDVSDKILHIYADNQISICNFLDELECIDTDYSFIDNKIYFDDESYLKSGSELIVDESTLVFKDVKNANFYTLLCFERD